MNWNMTRNVSPKDLYADAQRQYEEDVRACYVKWTEARDEALIMLKARLALTDACEDYVRESAAADSEADEYAEKWGGENVRPPNPWRGGPDDEPLTAYELRELRHDEASDRRDNAEAVYESLASVRRG